MDDQKRDLANKDKSAEKNEMLEVKLESVCDEKDEDVPEEMTLEKQTKTLHIR